MDDFLALYPKANTRISYNRALRRYLEYIFRIPANRHQKTNYNDLSLKYLSADRDHLADFRDFVSSLAKYAPKTALLYYTGALLWLTENGIEISQRDLKRIASRLPKGGTQTRDTPLDHQTLRSLLPHLPIQGKALVLVLASSGMRIGETLKLSVRDIDLSTDPVQINIPGNITKSGAPRLTFVTAEAAETVREWLKVRDRYLVAAQQRNNGLIAAGKSRRKPKADDRLFPFSSKNAWQMWNNALSSAGLLDRDPTTNRLTRSYHGLRRFYLSQSKLVIPAEIPETLAGHSGYLSDAYRRYSDQELADYYTKAEPQLTIQTPQEIREIQSEFRQKMDVHTEILENLVSENIQLKHRLESVEAVQAQVNRLSAVLAEHREVFRS